MSDLKKYKLENPFSDFAVVVEINHDLLTEPLLHEINNFWSESESRLDIEGKAFPAVMGLLYKSAWWAVVTLGGCSDAEIMVRYFSDRLEGWPLLDGSFGIKFVSIDSVEFDELPEITEVT